MATKIWMIGTEQGCPLSHTLRVDDPVNHLLPSHKYKFVRNSSCSVADEHVERILAIEINDVQGRPQNYFTTSPPIDDMDDSDKLRMVVESTQNQVDALTSLLGEKLGVSDEELAKQLGMVEDEEEETDFLEGMIDPSGTGE